MLSKEEKSATIKKSQSKVDDTGSPEVQIALLTEQIKKLTVHMKANPHDFSSKRGMDKMISRRNKLLAYLKKTDLEKYDKVTKQLKDSKKSK